MNEEIKISLSVLVINIRVNEIIEKQSDYTQSNPPEKKSSHQQANAKPPIAAPAAVAQP